MPAGLEARRRGLRASCCVSGVVVFWPRRWRKERESLIELAPRVPSPHVENRGGAAAGAARAKGPSRTLAAVHGAPPTAA